MHVVNVERGLFKDTHGMVGSLSLSLSLTHTHTHTRPNTGNTYRTVHFMLNSLKNIRVKPREQNHICTRSIQSTSNKNLIAASGQKES